MECIKKIDIVINKDEFKIVTTGHTRPDVCSSVSTSMFLFKYVAEYRKLYKEGNFKTNLDGFIELKIEEDEDLLNLITTFLTDLQESYSEFINLKIIGGNKNEK